MTAGAVPSVSRVRVGQRLTWLAQGTVFVTCGWLAGLIDRAEGRGLTANSLVGVSLPLALCSAVWFSGRRSLDLLDGMLALGGWLLARAVAAGLAAEQAETVGQGAVGQGTVGQGAVRHESVRQPDIRKGAVRGFAWLFAVGSAAGECVIYVGIAAAGQPGGSTGTWPLAITTIISVTLADMLTWIGRARGAPVGLRVAVAGMALVLCAPRAAFTCVLAVAAVSIGVAVWRLASRPPQGDVAAWLPRRPELVVAYRDDGALARWAGQLVRGNIMPLPPICAGVTAIVLLAVLGLGGMPDIVALAPLMALLLAAPGSAHPHDGPADWLAPVLLAFGQFIYLAALGLARQVPGPIVFALCALTAIWYMSIATWSQALPTVSGSDRSEGVVSGSDASGGVRPLGGLGWESRMFIVTFTAIAGIATLGYLGLSAYLGALICRKVVTGYLPPARAAS